MFKLYGYKESDLIALSQFITGGKFSGKSLTECFKNYAAATGRSAGSVRNLYYALAKYSRENAGFTAEYLNGKPIEVGKSENFSAQEAKNLVEKIENYKRRGVSVRKATLMLAGGDAKTALRFQNKYRTLIRAGENSAKDASRNGIKIIPAKEFLVNRLKKEIDRLTDRLFSGLKTENEKLKKEVYCLKSENARLYRELYGKNGRVIGYFGRNGGAAYSEIPRP